MRFDMICEAKGIEHRLTKPNHPWTNGQVERMGGLPFTIKLDDTVGGAKNLFVFTEILAPGQMIPCDVLP
jgi:transposase InsO family protein